MSDAHRRSVLTSHASPVLVMLARVPLFGQVKTRLARHIGEPQALQIHLQLLEHNARIAKASGLRFELHMQGKLDSPWFRRFQQRIGLTVRQQVAGDIGQKMLAAAEACRHRDGIGTASIVIGSDCGALTVDYLRLAAAELAHSPVVLGSAEDGGYVLIGQQKPNACLFTDISWGTASVATETRARARDAGLNIKELSAQWDVDTVTDWRRWRQLKAGG